MFSRSKNFSNNFVFLLKSSIFAVPIGNERVEIFGVWRSWLAHLVWDQRVQCSSHCTPTEEDDHSGRLLFLLVADQYLTVFLVKIIVTFTAEKKTTKQHNNYG